MAITRNKLKSLVEKDAQPSEGGAANVSELFITNGQVNYRFPLKVSSGVTVWAGVYFEGINDYVEPYLSSVLGWGDTPVEGGRTAKEALNNLAKAIGATLPAEDEDVLPLFVIVDGNSPRNCMVFVKGVFVDTVKRFVRDGDAFLIPTDDAKDGVFGRGRYVFQDSSEARANLARGTYVLCPLFNGWHEMEAAVAKKRRIAEAGHERA